ncbi:MAG: DUF1570 domain-containing protein [Pirellulales bacterium]|nr:DUF1570 domain-containing protein [Pirellulales bacterium]
MCRAFLSVMMCILVAESSYAQQLISFRPAGEVRPLITRYYATDAVGDSVVQSTDGRLHSISKGNGKFLDGGNARFKPLGADQVGRDVQQRLGAGFSVYRTQNYVVVYESSREFAKWCGMFVERLNRTYYAFWKNQNVPLKEPAFPLIVVVYKDRNSFETRCRQEVGDGVIGILGYYSQHSNLVHVYDMTPAIKKETSPSNWSGTVLRHANGERQVATLVHEAAHQLACNAGLQQRLAPYPAWLSEGIAMFFETPNLTHQKGWNGIGSVHRQKLSDFIVAQRDGLCPAWRDVIQSNGSFSNSETALAAYSQSWLLTYYLYKRKRAEFVHYVQQLAETKPFDDSTKERSESVFFKAFELDANSMTEALRRFSQSLVR